MWRPKIANPDASFQGLFSDIYFDDYLELFKTTQNVFT